MTKADEEREALRTEYLRGYSDGSAAPPQTAREVTDEMINAAAREIWNDRDARHGGAWDSRDPMEVCVIQTKATARAALKAINAQHTEGTAMSDRFYIVNQHIGWLKQYIVGMSDANWRDMRLRAERQLEGLSEEIDKIDAALLSPQESET